MNHKKPFFIALAVALIIASSVPSYAGQPALPLDAVADHIVVDKSDHTLTLFKDGKALKTYPVSLGRAGLARKTMQGDGLTPEGHYTIDGHNAKSAFYRSLHIDYPNKQDIKNAKKLGQKPGSHIMVHGIRNNFGFFGKAQRLVDWTNGCIALTNREMDELWRAIPDGTPIDIQP